VRITLVPVHPVSPSRKKNLPGSVPPLLPPVLLDHRHPVHSGQSPFRRRDRAQPRGGSHCSVDKRDLRYHAPPRLIPPCWCKSLFVVSHCAYSRQCVKCV